MNPSERYFRPAKTVLLTGAGFTKPFGGFLADEMWAVILNQPEIRQYPDLRKRMLEELNYETLYEEVLASDHYTPDARNAFANAIRNAYQHMHENICTRSGLEHRSRACRVCTDFIGRFAGQEGTQEKGFVFTLNQDLLVEQFYSASRSLMKIPGLHNPKWFRSQPHSRIEEEDRVSLPVDQAVEREKAKCWRKSSERLVYLKLHGSYAWRAHDGSEIMVIGYSKTNIIENEPLLNWYFSLFKEILGEAYEEKEKRNLVVIGYGFRDPHINEVIANAIQNVRLYVVSPMLPGDFKKRLLPVHAAGAECIPSEEYKARNLLWNGLFGYYQTSVEDFYDKNGSVTPTCHAFFRDLGLN